MKYVNEVTRLTLVDISARALLKMGSSILSFFPAQKGIRGASNAQTSPFRSFAPAMCCAPVRTDCSQRSCGCASRTPDTRFRVCQTSVCHSLTAPPPNLFASRPSQSECQKQYLTKIAWQLQGEGSGDRSQKLVIDKRKLANEVQALKDDKTKANAKIKALTAQV